MRQQEASPASDPYLWHKQEGHWQRRQAGRQARRTPDVRHLWRRVCTLLHVRPCGDVVVLLLNALHGSAAQGGGGGGGQREDRRKGE